MNRDQFNKTGFTGGMFAVWEGEVYPVAEVELFEGLIGLLNEDSISWKRCESVEVFDSKELAEESLRANEDQTVFVATDDYENETIFTYSMGNTVQEAIEMFCKENADPEVLGKNDITVKVFKQLGGKKLVESMFPLNFVKSYGEDLSENICMNAEMEYWEAGCETSDRALTNETFCKDLHKLVHGYLNPEFKNMWMLSEEQATFKVFIGKDQNPTFLPWGD